MQRDYFLDILKRLLSFCFLVIMMFILTGCESSDLVGDDYNLENEVQGTVLTEEQLIEEINKIDMSKSVLPYCEIKGKNLSLPVINHMISIDQYINIDITLKYDLSSDEQNSIKIYMEAKTDNTQAIGFIKDGYAYSNITKNNISSKNKYAILQIFASSKKQEIVSEIFKRLDFNEIYTKASEGLKDLIKQANNGEAKLEAIKDINGKTVVTYQEDELLGRIVFKDEKILYVAVKDGDIEQTVSFNYNKPKFSFPSTTDYKEISE